MRGTNILNAWPSLAKDQEEDFEQARKKLMDRMVEYAHYTGQFVILVFDEYKVKKNPGEEFYYKGIHVVFTKAMQTADHYIEQELNLIGRHRRVRVATSDGMEQQIILSRGGTRISARELELEVAHAREGLLRRKNRLKEEGTVNSLEEATMESLLELKNRLDPH